MQNDWYEFLIDRNANIENARVLHFGSADLPVDYNNINILCDLSQYGLIQVSGGDSTSFLQGQLSNDLMQVSDSHSQLTSYSTPKGRMLAIFRVFVRDGNYYFRLPADLIEPTLRRLQMFVLRADVKLHDASDELVRFGLTGADSANLLEKALGVYPREIDDCVQTESVTVIRVPGMNPRFEVFGPVEKMTTLWTQFEDASTPVGADTWSLLELKAGLPTVYSQTSEAFVPQMANLDLLNGVNFKKGCYPGQEIIARMHYLGTLKRRMYLMHSDSESQPAPGDSIYSENDSPGQPSGTIVDAQLDPEGGVSALAVIRIAQTENAVFHLGSPDGIEFKLDKQPYEIGAIS